ncbi:MAG: redoxin family protein [Xanthomonadales bacterium]|nr:redoxin family protein [Xanthomonadales bacterium]
MLSGQARSSRVLLGLALLVSFASALAAEPAGSQADAATQPELRVETLAHGSFDLATRRGHWVLLNFWATWCAPCLNEMPELDAFDKAHDDAEVIGLAWEETTAEELATFLGQRPVSYPVALLDVYAPPKDFPAPRGLPLSVLIAPDGTVHKKFLGPVTRAELEREIRTAEPASPPVPGAGS